MSVEFDHNDDMSEEDLTVLESNLRTEQVGEQLPSKKRKRSRKLTSIVWRFFDLIELENGEEQAKCKKCGIEYKYDSSKGGTSTLDRHRLKCMTKQLTGTEFMQAFAAAKQNGAQQSDKSELDQYLSEPPLHLSTHIDILQYWKGQELRFPALTRMAADILAIPISTVASESAFSLGGRVLDRYRSSLSPDSAEALITTRDWICGIGVGSSDFVEVEDSDICEDVLGFESTNNNEAIEIDIG